MQRVTMKPHQEMRGNEGTFPASHTLCISVMVDLCTGVIKGPPVSGGIFDLNEIE